MAYTHDSSVDFPIQIRNLLLEMLTGIGAQRSTQPTGDATLVVDAPSTYTFPSNQSYITIQLHPTKTTARLGLRWHGEPCGWTKWDAILTTAGLSLIASPPGMQTDTVIVISNEALSFMLDFSIMGWA